MATPPGSDGSRRTLIIVLAIILFGTATVASGLYVQNLNQSNTIANQSSTIGKDGSTIKMLQGNLSAQNTEILALNQQIASLRANGSASQAQIHTLQLQLSQLENQSALMRLEISLLGQVGGLGINAFAVNETWTVQPNSTILVGQEANQYNGSLFFICYSACPSDLGVFNNANGEKGMTLWFYNSTNPISPNPISFNIGENVGPQEWAVYLRNIGSTPIQFTGSLYYVYQVPCTLCSKTTP